MIKKENVIFACYGPHNLIKDIKHGKISGGKLFTLHSLIFGLKWLISIENMIKKEKLNFCVLRPP